MEHLILVRPGPPGQLTAQSVAFPEVRAIAATESEAVDQVRKQLTDWLQSAKLVRVEVPALNGDNPWIKSFGRSANDPDLASYLEEIQKARQLDAAE